MSYAPPPDPLFRPLEPTDPSELGGYQIRARLGAGGMGRVYLGATPDGRRLAVKVVRSEFTDEPEFRRRFAREIDAARRVHGPFTAGVVDADPGGNPPWLATEYIPGPSLAAAVAGHGALPETTVRTLVAGIAEALRAVHGAGIVHRDLKPSNVLLGPDGPYVIDFGIARATDATPLTRTGFQLGTPMFMAPEQALGEPAHAAADVWALGALAFFAATAQKPFGDGPESAVLYRVVHEEPGLAACPEFLRPLVTACLDKDPARRPSVESLLASGAEWLGDPRPGPGWLPPSVTNAAARYADTPPGPVFVPVATTMAPPVSPPAAPVAGTAEPGGAGGAGTRSRTRRRIAVGVVSFGVAVAGLGLAATLVLAPDEGENGAGAPPADDGGTSATAGGAAEPPAGAGPTPGTYPLDRDVFDDGTWRLVLTEVEVGEDGTMTARVAYHNESGVTQQLSCAVATDPAASSVEYADGTTAESTATYCSDHPTRTWSIPAGEAFTSYAVFPAPDDGQAEFTLDWQPGQSPSGRVEDITLG